MGLIEDVVLRGHNQEAILIEFQKHALGCSQCGNLIDANPGKAKTVLEWGIVLLEADLEENES